MVEQVKMKVIIAFLFCVFTYIACIDVDVASTDESEKSEKYKEFDTCSMEDGGKGICVPFYWCNGTHVMPGGDLTEGTGFRESTDTCPEIHDICCSIALIDDTQPKPSDTADKCLLLDSDICPWCVKLYKSKTPDIEEHSSRAFCVGAMIGSHVVLTSASCLVAAQRYSVYARVPLSNDPDKKYPVKLSKMSPHYNKGTHYYDFGLLLFGEGVEWGARPGGACLGFTEPQGTCMTLGFNNKDDFVTTLLDVTKGGCPDLGGSGSPEIYCGRSTEEHCYAQQGAPVVCQADGGIVLMGVTRSGCVNQQVALGGIEDTRTSLWLRDTFKTLNVSEAAFVP